MSHLLRGDLLHKIECHTSVNLQNCASKCCQAGHGTLFIQLFMKYEKADRVGRPDKIFHEILSLANGLVGMPVIDKLPNVEAQCTFYGGFGQQYNRQILPRGIRTCFTFCRTLEKLHAAFLMKGARLMWEKACGESDL